MELVSLYSNLCHHCIKILSVIRTEKNKTKTIRLSYLDIKFRFFASHLLVPTLWFDGMSMVFVAELCFTAKPKSAMTAVPFFFTRIFLDFRSL